MDTERLRVLQISVDLAYTNWSKDPTRLSYIKNLRNTIEILQDATIDELLYGTKGDTAPAEEKSDCHCSGCEGLNYRVVGNETSDEREARTDREASERLNARTRCQYCLRGELHSICSAGIPSWPR